MKNSILLLSILMLSLASCVKKGGFLTPSCSHGNSNCELPSLQVEVVGSEGGGKAQVDNEGEAGAVAIKAVRFGEKARIEFILQNPKLIPLRKMIFSMEPGDSAFSLVNVMTGKDCRDESILLLYKQKCSVMVEFQPGRVPPPTQKLTFKFETILGAHFTFRANFDPAKLLSDFFLAESDLTMLDAAVISGGGASPSAVGKDILIENTGTETDLSGIQFFINGSSDWSLGTPSATPACSQGGSVAKRGGSCYVRVQFGPSSPGLKNATLVMVSGDQVSREFPLTGTGKGLSADVDHLDFGSVSKGSTTKITKSISLSFPDVAGDSPAKNCTYVDSNSLTGTGFRIATNTCSATQAQGSTCAVSVEWTPSATAKEHDAEFSWECDEMGGAGRVPLLARSSTSPLVTDKLELNFGDVLEGSNKSLSFTLKNNGKNLGDSDGIGTLIDLKRTVSGPPFSEVSSTCTDKIKIDGDCTATLNYAPTSPGSHFGAFSATAAQTEMDSKVALQGHAISVTPSASRVDFGTIAPNSDRPGSVVYIRNPSTFESATSCKLIYDDIANQNYSLDSDSTCLTKTSLAAGESCTVRARLTAQATEGDRQSMVQYQCDIGGTANVVLLGHIKIEKRLVVAPPSSYFLTDHLVGTTNNLEFILVNGHTTETASALAVTPATLSNGWSVVSSSGTNCSAVTDLAPGQSCHVRLQSSPSAAAGVEELGPFSSSIGVSASGGVIDPPDASFGSLNQKLTSNYEAGFEFDSLDVDESSDSLPIRIFNPSPIDAASGCSAPSITSATSGAFTIASSSCGTSGLLPLGSCRVVVTFNGSATAAAIEGNLDYHCSVGGRARTPLKVAVVPKLKYRWTGDGNFGFLDLNQPAVERTFTFTNNETATMEISSVSLSNTSGFSIVSSGTTCTIDSHLASGQSCTVKIAFDTSEEISYTSKLIVTGRPVGSSTTPEQHSKSLFGAGAQMTMAASSSSLTFNDQQASSSMTETKTFTITNNGSRPADLSYSTLAAPFSKGTGGSCGSVLVEGQSCTVEVKMTAGVVAAGNQSATFTVSETSSGGSIELSVALSGRILAVPQLVIKDDVTNSATTTLATSDFTGAVGDARNIVDHGSTKTVTYTVTNNVANAASITLGNVTLTYKSGQNNTMTLVSASNACNEVSLASNASCTFAVTYTPTQDHETSTYSLSLSGTDLANGTKTTSVTDVVGHSYKSATLVFSPTSLDFGSLAKEVAATAQEISITNTGDYTATLGSFSFAGTGGSDYSTSDGTSSPNCSTTLAAGATCYKKIGLKPTLILGYQNTGSLSYQYTVGITPLTKSTSLAAKAISYVQLSATGVGTGSYGEEGEIAADDNRVYVSSRFSNFTTYSMPVITVCDRQTGGYVGTDTTLCHQNLLEDASYNSGLNKLVGTLNGSGPKIAVSGNYIFLAVNNEDAHYDDNLSDGVNLNTSGNSTVIVCKKPGVDGTITFTSDCAVVAVDLKASGISTGAYPSMAIVGNKLAISNTISGSAEKGLIIHVCSFDTSQTDPVNVIDKASCKNATKDLLDANRAQMGSLDFQGSHIVVAYYNRVNNEESLNAVSCNVANDNSLTCGNSTVISSDLLDLSSPVAPGAYPSVSIDNSKIYIAHQQGETTHRYLRLSDCTLSGTNNTAIGSCSTQTVATRAGSEGIGVYPRLSRFGSGSGAKLWISYLGAAGETVFTNVYSGLRYCTLQAAGSPSCETNAYFEKKTLTAASATFVSRGHFLDAINKVILIPQAMTSSKKMGVLSIGLYQDLFSSP